MISDFIISLIKIDLKTMNCELNYFIYYIYLNAEAWGKEGGLRGVYLSIYLSIYIFIYPSIYLSIYLSICPSIYLMYLVNIL